MKGILGRKIGMTSVFAKNGKLVPVTVIEVEPNIVSQIKTKEKDISTRACRIFKRYRSYA